MRRTTMPIESELRGVRNAIKALRRGKGPIWLLPSLRKREKALSAEVQRRSQEKRG
jgi:hypothetical protein